MAEEDSRGGWNSKARLIVGCTVGVLLGAGFVHAEFTVSPRNAVAGLFEASSGNVLRVLQSVGILLPLFTGLLRFTTSDRSEVSERVNDYLLLGIFGLVLAGVSATIAGMLTALKGILKLSLLFILFTFIVIGLAAVAMLGEFASETDGSEITAKVDDADETQDTDDTKRFGQENAEDGVTSNAGVESERGSNEETEQAEDSIDK